MVENEIEGRCIYCIHYDTWFGACFAEQDGFGDPRIHNLRYDNFNNRGALCDLFKWG